MRSSGRGWRRGLATSESRLGVGVNLRRRAPSSGCAGGLVDRPGGRGLRHPRLGRSLGQPPGRSCRGERRQPHRRPHFEGTPRTRVRSCRHGIGAVLPILSDGPHSSSGGAGIRSGWSRATWSRTSPRVGNRRWQNGQVGGVTGRAAVIGTSRSRSSPSQGPRNLRAWSTRARSRSGDPRWCGGTTWAPPVQSGRWRERLFGVESHGRHKRCDRNLHRSVSRQAADREPPAGRRRSTTRGPGEEGGG